VEGTKMPSPEDYRLLVEREWADLHHSRMQEWTALGVVTGGHVGLMQLAKMAIEASTSMGTVTIIICAATIGAIFAILGALMTCRHRQLMKVKLGWIYTAEEHLGLIKTKNNEDEGIIPEDAKMSTTVRWRRLALPRLFSTSGIILCFYVTFLLIDISAIVLFITE
jgi:hypothetical protein